LPNSSVSTAIRVNVTAALTLADRTWNYWLYSTIGGHFGASPVSKPAVSYGHGERSDWILEIWHALNGFCGWLLHCKRFLSMFAVIFVSTVVCPACLCFGIASTGPSVVAADNARSFWRVCC